MPEPYSERPAEWGADLADSLPLSLALLADCTGEQGALTSDAESTTAWRLHRQFAETVLCPLDAASPLALEWYEVQSWLDEQTLGELGLFTSCIRRIRDFEQLLKAALDEKNTTRPRHVSPAMWSQWDIETVVSLCMVAGQPGPEILGRFADHLLDLKFKLYCLLEVDLPIYTDAINKWGLEADDVKSTPQGFAVRLSEEVTLILKSRAVWESVMNAVYWLESGRDIPSVSETDDLGITFKSKTGKFFPWVADQAQWSSLGTFKPLVDNIDLLRMSEVHRFSRVRANFTKQTLEPIERCVELLNRILTYVFDHLVAVIALRRTVSYDAESKTSMTLS
jgi:hypothetical protein